MKKLRGQFDINLCDGTQLGVILNMYALGQFLDQENANLNDLEELFSTQEKVLRSVPELLWHGVQAFYDLKDAETPLSKKRFLVLLGSSEWDDILEHMKTALELSDGTKKKTAKAAKKVSR